MPQNSAGNRIYFQCAFANIFPKNIRMYLKQIKANNKCEKMLKYDNIAAASPNKKAIWIFANCYKGLFANDFVLFES